MNPIEIEPELDEDEAEEQITEIYGTFKIGYAEFDAGRILKELDPTMFQMAKQDLEDGLDHKWECGNCGEQFDTEDEAEDCCKLECGECRVWVDPMQLEDGLCENCRKLKTEDGENAS